MTNSKLYTAGPCRFKDCTIGCQRFKCNNQNSEYCGLCHHDYGFHEASYIDLADDPAQQTAQAILALQGMQGTSGQAAQQIPPPKSKPPQQTYPPSTGIFQAQNLNQAQQALQAHHLAQAQKTQSANCSKCKDTGKVECTKCDKTGLRLIPCELCIKSGYKKCKSCRGHGKFSDKCSLECSTNFKEEVMTKEVYAEDASRYWDTKAPTKQLVTFTRCSLCKGILKPCKACVGLGSVRCDYCNGEKYMTYNCDCANDFTIPCQCVKQPQKTFSSA